MQRKLVKASCFQQPAHGGQAGRASPESNGLPPSSRSRGTTARQGKPMSRCHRKIIGKMPMPQWKVIGRPTPASQSRSTAGMGPMPRYLVAVIVNVAVAIGLLLKPDATAMALTVCEPVPVIAIRRTLLPLGNTADAVVGLLPSVV